MFKMELEYKQGVLFARLKGILNKKGSNKINNYLNSVIKKHDIKYLVYNFKELKMIDESGVNAIINSKRYIKENKGTIKVCNTIGYFEYLRKYLKLNKISNELEVYKEMEVL